MTRAEKIRKMSDDELAEFLCGWTESCYKCLAEALCICGGGKANGYLTWLNEMEEDGEQDE